MSTVLEAPVILPRTAGHTTQNGAVEKGILADGKKLVTLGEIIDLFKEYRNYERNADEAFWIKAFTILPFEFCGENIYYAEPQGNVAFGIMDFVGYTAANYETPTITQQKILSALNTIAEHCQGCDIETLEQKGFMRCETHTYMRDKIKSFVIEAFGRPPGYDLHIRGIMDL